eukprot:TRINITY_DN316_c2_g1_i1.p1 TRINITY_DN316_c2_g1~~TRINITY_DN316_c2_g1_i1.p1  ORF type:complete len:104 (+),score=4.91 TRINITY_DN316_c2_g1_i1:573-884(+)
MHTHNNENHLNLSNADDLSSKAINGWFFLPIKGWSGKQPKHFCCVIVINTTMYNHEFEFSFLNISRDAEDRLFNTLKPTLHFYQNTKLCNFNIPFTKIPSYVI